MAHPSKGDSIASHGVDGPRLTDRVGVPINIRTSTWSFSFVRLTQRVGSRGGAKESLRPSSVSDGELLEGPLTPQFTFIPII